MKTGAIIAVVVGVVVVLYLAVSRGLIGSGVAVSVGPGGVTTAHGIVAPQPGSNYSGYLAATTAPGVSSALNGLLTGVGGAFTKWLTPNAPAQPAPAQGANAASPSLAAQPSGPVPAAAFGSASATGSGAPVGPMVPPDISYNATAGSAFDYSGLAGDNGYDPSFSLMES